MIDIVIVEGTSFEEAASIATVSLEVLPRIGETITFVGDNQYKVIAVNHEVQPSSKTEIHVLVEEVDRDQGDPMPMIV